MKKITFIVLLLSSIGLFSQETIQYGRNNSQITTEAASFDPELAPFYHGVASGDPLSDRVIIWTRITPEDDQDTDVLWRMATDIAFTNVIQEGSFTTNASIDYTVKIDVEGLQPETTYYYHFYDAVTSKSSIIGRTRTAPTGTSDMSHLRFAITSCSNYQAGYFNAYKKIAERQDLDAVIHLGDYIYEYGGGPGTYGYDESRADRINEPIDEIIELVDYRARYSLYRLDPDLRAAHQQNPFITIWDDHESANDSYRDGAENHDDSEGAWEDRKSISKQVYFEWLPIRNHPDNKITRVLSYGDLATIINLDTRLEGREEQIVDATNPDLYNEDRTMLGAPQKEWLLNELSSSTSKWNLITNQVMFAEFNVGWVGPILNVSPDVLESTFLDIWDGYPAERDIIVDYIKDNEIDNVVFLTGDVHTTFSFDISKRPTDNHPDDAPVDYDPETGEGSIAVEFVGPSITSANFDENLPPEVSQLIASGINAEATVNGFQNPNPHMKYTNLDDHGYYVLDITEERAQSDYYFVDIFDTDAAGESFGEGWFTNDTENRLIQADAEAEEKIDQPDLAPEDVPDFGQLSTEDVSKDFEIFSIYPNPNISQGQLYLQFGKRISGDFSINLYTIKGNKVASFHEGNMASGVFFSQYNLPQLASGIYLLTLENKGQKLTRKLVIK
ncbi:MAG: alkaline phosphatase D [Dokdonia sp.]|jgi:alkaline phosphatase D